MKAIHHVVSGDLNLDEVISETDRPFDWFPELKDNKIFENFNVKSLTIDIELDAENLNRDDIKRIYFVIEK